MSFRNNAKPTPGNIRRRLLRTHTLTASALELAKRWNPKGRYFRAQRDLIQGLTEIGSRVDQLLLGLPSRR